MEESIKLLEKQLQYHSKEAMLCTNPTWGTIPQSMEHLRMAEDFARGLAVLKATTH